MVPFGTFTAEALNCLLSSGREAQQSSITILIRMYIVCFEYKGLILLQPNSPRSNFHSESQRDILDLLLFFFNSTAAFTQFFSRLQEFSHPIFFKGTFSGAVNYELV